MLSFFLSLILFQTQEEPTPPDPIEAERLESEQRDTLNQAQQATEEAEALAQEIADLQQRLVAAGQRARTSETAALQAEQEILQLGEQEAIILARLTDDRESLIDILAALQRIETQAPPAILAAPHDAAEAARAASLMSEIAPALTERAEALSLELENLRQIRTQTLAQQETLSIVEASLVDQRSEIESLITQRLTLEALRRAEADSLALEASRIGARARSLRSLIGELQRMSSVQPNLNPRRQALPDSMPVPRMRPPRNLVSAQAPTTPLQSLRFADARGQLRQPATGRIIRDFGQLDAEGVESEGIFIRTRARAQVISPFDARVEFAGPFNTYGGLLILNVGDNYYVIIAGMAATFASTGQNVLAGEPVGAMPDTQEPAPELYLELRRGNIAVDPKPWLRTGTEAG